MPPFSAADGALTNDRWQLSAPVLLGADGAQYPAAWRIDTAPSLQFAIVVDDRTLPPEAYPYVIDPLSGPRSPGTAIGTLATPEPPCGGTTNWSSPGNVFVSDDNRTYVDPGVGNASRCLRVSNFGFRVPANDAIKGIRVQIEKGKSGSGATYVDKGLRLVDDTVTVGSGDKGDTSTPWPGTTDEVWCYPGTTTTCGAIDDLWGENPGFWTPAKVNDADFGAALAVNKTASGTPNARVDHVTLTIFHAPDPAWTCVRLGQCCTDDVGNVCAGDSGAAVICDADADCTSPSAACAGESADDVGMRYGACITATSTSDRVSTNYFLSQYEVVQELLEFNAQALIPDDALMTAAFLRLSVEDYRNVTANTLQMRAFEWGGTCDAGDWDGSGPTAFVEPLATYAHQTGDPPHWVDTMFDDPTTINKSGPTRFNLRLQNEYPPMSPGDADYVWFSAYDNTTYSGPELCFQYATATPTSTGGTPTATPTATPTQTNTATATGTWTATATRTSTSVATATSIGTATASGTLTSTPLPPGVPPPIGRWAPIGPAPFSVENAPPNNDRLAGIVCDLAIDPQSPDRVYIGTFGGGLWRTTGGGDLWTPRTDQGLSLEITSTAVHPTRPNFIVAGSGFFYNADGKGAGVLRSLNGGDEWCAIGPPHTQVRSQADFDVEDVAIDYTVTATPDTVLWAATSSGLYYSTNAETAGCGDVTWTVATGGLPAKAVNNVLLSPWDNRVVYASISLDDGDGVADPDKGWWRSTDRGQTWDQINGVLPNFSTPPGAPLNVRRRAAIGKQEGATGTDVVYSFVGDVQTTCTDGSSGPRGRVVKGVVSNAGATWELLTATRTCQTAADCCEQDCACNNNRCAPDPDCGGLRSLAVQAEDADIVALGVEQIYRSLDGGASGFFQLARGILHDDIQALAFAPSNPNILFAGTDGGIWKSDNFGNSQVAHQQVSWTNLNGDGLANLEFHRSGDPDVRNSGVSYGGTQDNGVLKGGTVLLWRGGGGAGDDGPMSIDRRDSNVIYLGAIERSRDGLFSRGANILSNVPPPVYPGEIPGFRFGLDPSHSDFSALVTYSRNPNTLIGGRGVWRTTDATGDPPTWARLGTFVFLSHASAYAIAPSVPPSNLIFAATEQHGVYRTTDGSTWQSYGAGLPTRFVRSLTIDASAPCDANACTVYATFRDGPGHVFRTTGPAATWQNISGPVCGINDAVCAGLPDVEVWRVVIHPQCSNVIYAATEVGVFQGTHNDGQCGSGTDGQWAWARMMNGLPDDVIVRDLTVHPDVGALRAYTYGRSAWELRLYDPVARRANVRNPATDNPTTDILAGSIQVAANHAGQLYGVVWADDRAGENNWHIQYRTFAADPLAARSPDDVQVDDNGTQQAQAPALAGHPDPTTGVYCARVAWHDHRSGANHIFFQYVCDDGYVLYMSDVPAHNEDLSSANNATDPAITFNPVNRGFAVAWQREVTPGNATHEIYARFYNVWGVELYDQCGITDYSGPCKVNTSTANATDPAAVADADDNTFVTWTEADSEIWLRKYDVDGAPQTSPVRVDRASTYACAGGSSAGAACAANADCPGGTCGPAAGNVTRGESALAVSDPVCVGGPNPGVSCSADANCTPGTCEPILFVTWQEQVGSGPETVFGRRFGSRSLSALDTLPVKANQPPGLPEGVQRAVLPSAAADLDNNFGVGWQGNVNGDATTATPWNGFARIVSATGVTVDNDFRLDVAPRTAVALDPRIARGPFPRCYALAWRDNHEGQDNVYTRIAYPLP
jgi:hypothetical protein